MYTSSMLQLHILNYFVTMSLNSSSLVNSQTTDFFFYIRAGKKGLVNSLYHWFLDPQNLVMLLIGAGLKNKGSLIGENLTTGFFHQVSFSPINEPLFFSPAPINNIPRFCGSQNKSGIGCSPDPFSRPNLKEKRGLAT